MSSVRSSESDSLLTALVSGTSAAAVAATITFPLDSLKTQQQLNNNALVKKFNIVGNYPSTLSQVFRGTSALVLGSVFKNSARLILYNWLSKFMAIDTHNAKGEGVQKTSAPRMVIAAAMSAFIESLWIVPFENIKITMIQNMLLTNEIAKNPEINVTGVSAIPKHHKPAANVFSKQYVSPHAYFTSELLAQYKTGKPPSRFTPEAARTNTKDALKLQYNKSPSTSFFGTVREIYSLKGLNGFTAGASITVVRQVGISSMWLSTYNATRQLLDPHSSTGEQSWFGHKHTAIQLTGLHVFASLAVIAVTQPLDVIKSHMQLKNGKAIYKDSLYTAYKLFVDDGPRALFRGSLPRLFKVTINGGLTALVYSSIENVVQVAGGQTVFSY